ncbi:hypothetical protein PR048_030905 [Dryococelus australis]|uniref:Uncharacterized protein n=1 Tax=Dryococelus australis TaxID=614101 RepID=A0ABQ9GA82_9NEOP|nr:hypothetical protein PR048_030905 [Dryococelus australis]
MRSGIEFRTTMVQPGTSLPSIVGRCGCKLRESSGCLVLDEETFKLALLDLSSSVVQNVLNVRLLRCLYVRESWTLRTGVLYYDFISQIVDVFSSRCAAKEVVDVKLGRQLTSRTLEPVRVKRGEYGAALECQSGGEREIPEKTPPTATSTGTIPTRENPGCDPAGNRTRFAYVGGEQSNHYTTDKGCSR